MNPPGSWMPGPELRQPILFVDQHLHGRSPLVSVPVYRTAAPENIGRHRDSFSVGILRKWEFLTMCYRRLPVPRHDLAGNRRFLAHLRPMIGLNRHGPYRRAPMTTWITHLPTPAARGFRRPRPGHDRRRERSALPSRPCPCPRAWRCVGFLASWDCATACQPSRSSPRQALATPSGSLSIPCARESGPRDSSTMPRFHAVSDSGQVPLTCQWPEGVKGHFRHPHPPLPE